jgi:hypothetical protein
MAVDADHTRWFRVPDGGNHPGLNIRHRSSIRMLPATTSGQWANVSVQGDCNDHASEFRYSNQRRFDRALLDGNSLQNQNVELRP